MKTKSIFLTTFIIFAFFASSFGQSFTENVSFPEFETWVKSQNISGYNFYSTDQSSSEEEIRDSFYVGIFETNDDTQPLRIALHDISTFNDYLNYEQYKNQQTYMLDGQTAVYLPDDSEHSSSMLWVELPEINANLVIIKAPMLPQNKLEEIYHSLNLEGITGN
jgi:opacity protein-like surface antigen